VIKCIKLNIYGEEQMPIPDYQSIMLPLLKYASDSKPRNKKEAMKVMAEHFKLNPDELKELLPSGNQAIFDNRIGWALTYMKKAGILKSVSRGVFEITDRGKQLIKDGIKELHTKDLMKYDEFRDFQNKSNDIDQVASTEVKELTPEEMLDNTYRKVKNGLVIEIIEKIKECSPAFFERLVIEVIVSMGYGGSKQEAGKAIGQSGDEGIDGIIKEDKLGLDIIYLQAKRWENTVGRPEIQKFVGALEGKRANKGIFITTADYSREAKDYANSVNKKVVLIDGNMLAELMIENNVGVSTSGKYELKRIDNDYFEVE
jgi:restriction system protein